jgi:signal transduction histidine kinase/ActR/RegA family two-component response regulator
VTRTLGFPHPYLICLVACVGVGAFALVVLNRSLLLREANLAESQWRNIDATNERLLGTLRDAETGQRGYLLTRQIVYLEPYQSAGRTVAALTRKLNELTNDAPDERANVQQIAELAAQKLTELSETIGLAQSGDTDRALAVVATNRGKALMDRIRALATDVDTVAGRRATASRRAADGHARDLIAGVILMSGLSIALLIVLTYFHRRDGRRLREGAEQLEITLRSIGDAVVTTDADANVTFLNPIAIDLLRGAPVTTPVPFKQMFRLVNEMTGADAEDPIARVLRERRIIGLANHTALLRRDGTSISIEDSAAPLLDDQGRVRGVVFVFKDVTERRRAETALAEARAQLQTNLAALKTTEEELRTADRQKDAFLATLAHELRNPVAPIRHAVKLMENAGIGQEQMQWSRNVIARQIEHMARLLDDLLDSARITRGELMLQTAPVSLQSIVADALDIAKPLIERKDHRLEVILPERPLTLNVDGIRIAQVLSNLLTNAAKYTDSSGQIVIRATLAADHLSISVKDSGVGIRPETVPRLFRMFSQIKSTTDRSEGGLGIGLALANELVKLHGGTIEVHSGGEDQGSEFLIKLPLSLLMNEAPERKPESTNNAPFDGSRLILIVDDNVDAAASLAMLLELSGNEVLVAHTGQDAIDVARRYRPSIVILDIGLPRLDGYQVAQALRSDWQGARLLIIALTGWGQVQDKQRAMNAGFDYHFTKPVDVDAIQDAIAAHSRREAAN